MATSMTQQESTTNAGDKLSLVASPEEQLASGPTLQVHWRGLVHMRGTYPRECLVTQYHPGIGVKRDYGPDPKRRPRRGGPSDCAVSAKMVDSQDDIAENMRYRDQTQLIHSSIDDFDAQQQEPIQPFANNTKKGNLRDHLRRATSLLSITNSFANHQMEQQQEAEEEDLMEFYLDDMLNDDISGAMIELIRPIGGDHAELLEQLQKCYCTFFYVGEDEEEDKEMNRLRLEHAEERKRLKEERERIEKEEEEKEHKLNQLALQEKEKHKEEMRKVIRDERAAYRLEKQQKLQQQQQDRVELGLLSPSTNKQELGHLRALSKNGSNDNGDVYDHAMFAKSPRDDDKNNDSNPETTIKKGAIKKGDATETEEKIETNKKETKEEDAMDAAMDTAMDAAMDTAMNNANGDMMAAPGQNGPSMMVDAPKMTEEEIKEEEEIMNNLKSETEWKKSKREAKKLRIKRKKDAKTNAMDYDVYLKSINAQPIQKFAKTYIDYVNNTKNIQKQKNKQNKNIKDDEEKDKTVWNDPINYNVFNVEPTSLTEAEEEEEDMEIRILWEIEIDDAVEDGGTGWTTVLALRYRHDSTPHGSIQIGSSETAIIGWISIMSHDCRLTKQLDEDSEELYNCVLDGIETEMKSTQFKVTTLPKIEEENEIEGDEENEVEGDEENDIEGNEEPKETEETDGEENIGEENIENEKADNKLVAGKKNKQKKQPTKKSFETKMDDTPKKQASDRKTEKKQMETKSDQPDQPAKQPDLDQDTTDLLRPMNTDSSNDGNEEEEISPTNDADETPSNILDQSTSEDDALFDEFLEKENGDEPNPKKQSTQPTKLLKEKK